MPSLWFLLLLIILAIITPVAGVLMAMLDIDLLSAVIASPLLIGLVAIEAMQSSFIY